MTTEEKLEHFQCFCIEDARTRSAKMLDEYSSALEQADTEHQADAHRHADMQLKAETAQIRREINKQLSIEQIGLKRTFGQKQDELKDKLFVELKDKLANFMESIEYQHLLEAQVAAAKTVAGEEPLIVYLDPVDEDKMRRICLHHHVDIRISQYSFSGGTRAVIPSKNILIDNSFQTKVAEAKENFRFDLTAEAGGNIYG
ncbi:MAG: ATPase [Hungatella sp.]